MYSNRESVIVYHSNVFETSFSEVRGFGQYCPDQAEVMARSLRVLDEPEDETDADWWKWDVGCFMDSKTASTNEVLVHTRLSARLCLGPRGSRGSGWRWRN